MVIKDRKENDGLAETSVSAGFYGGGGEGTWTFTDIAPRVLT